MEYKTHKTGVGQYQKYNQHQGVQTRYFYDRQEDKLHVQYVQPIQKTLDINAQQRNGFQKFNKDLQHVARIPIVEWNKIMEMCGHKPGFGYDEEKFKRILNDKDYESLKTVPGRI